MPRKVVGIFNWESYPSTFIFNLGEHIEVKSAELEDGLLRLLLEEVLPLEKQPKVIKIK